MDESPIKPSKATRATWPAGFPRVDIHAKEARVKGHPYYAAAKAGDPDAAIALVKGVLNQSLIRSLRKYKADSPLLVPVQGIEGVSRNPIPMAMAVQLEVALGYPVAAEIYQTSKAAHTGATGWWRLLSQALFDGEIPTENCILVDDFVGMGGTYANLRGYVESKGGRVLSCVAMTGKPRSANIALTDGTLRALRQKYGADLEDWWKSTFGYGFDALTESEARYLIRAEDADTIRARLLEAAEQG